VPDAVGNTLAGKFNEDDERDRSVFIYVYPNGTIEKPLPKQVPKRPKIGPNSIKKLYIYDNDSSLDRSQARGRFGASEVLELPISGGIADLKTQLDKLLSSKQTFTHVLFQTHGGPGRIRFGDDRLNAAILKSQFAEYSSLFPTWTSIHFDGCNVAQDGEGTDFLLAAGHVFLKFGGGETFAWVNRGTAVPGWVPKFGGHTIHLGGANNLKRIRFFPGGRENLRESMIPAR
jgi:Domain of unknown function (DUF4347)